MAYDRWGPRVRKFFYLDSNSGIVTVLSWMPWQIDEAADRYAFAAKVMGVSWID